MAFPTLKKRERRLLFLCGATLVVLVTLILGREYSARLETLRDEEGALRDEISQHEAWLGEADFYAVREKWVDKHLPQLEGSPGRTQGQLLDELRDSALDSGLEMERPNLLAPSSNPHYQEVAIRMRVRGEQMALLRWLTTLQRPDQFRAVTALEVELDRDSEEAEPQAVCDLTVARWFYPESS